MNRIKETFAVFGYRFADALLWVRAYAFNTARHTRKDYRSAARDYTCDVLSKKMFHVQVAIERELRQR